VGYENETENIRNGRAVSQVHHGPGDTRRACMLASHKEGSEHMSDLPISDSASVLVLLTTEGSHHVAFVLGANQEGRATDEINKLTILFSTLRLWMMLT